jgi:hypothetical protein
VLNWVVSKGLTRSDARLHRIIGAGKKAEANRTNGLISSPNENTMSAFACLIVRRRNLNSLK